MITIPIIDSCAYTHTGQGILRINHDVLATLAGAVWDKIEWIALLKGTRSEDGLTVHVTDLQVPKQYRDRASCELVHQESLTPDIIGVIHSHHSMFAGFSPVDVDTLNPRFPLSLVIAQLKDYKVDPITTLLGFNYKAEGRVALPCKSIGIVPFMIQPNPLPKEWPQVIQAGFQTPTQAAYVPCPKMTIAQVGLTQHYSAPCGVSFETTATAVFGAEGEDFLKQVEAQTHYQTRNPVHFNIVDKGSKKNGPKRYIYDGEDDYLRHWNFYD